MGRLTHIMDAILSHHGQKLNKLNSHPIEELVNVSNGQDKRYISVELTKDRILQIQGQCLVLEEFAIPVKRRKSSAAEAEMCRCFDEMKILRVLFLTLDCYNWRTFRESMYNLQFNEEDQKPIDYPAP
jgi:hypothetical protein